MNKEKEMRLTRELGILRSEFSLCDGSAENKAKGERIKEIIQELKEAGIISETKARKNYRKSVIVWR